MQIKLEKLPYQETAIQSVVKVFDGNVKNTFDNACFEGIRSNICTLTEKQIENNIKEVITENGIDDNVVKYAKSRELTIEMETGTGKTLVYLKTICELYKNYSFTKFIILVPSVAIRQGIIKTMTTFEKQINELYGFVPDYFEYSSKKLSKVIHFIEEQHPQIMIMTLASFNSEDKILNQAQREDLFANKPFIESLAETNPFIIMDEPQEGMDTENSINQIAKLNPLFKIRYSATHKPETVKNRIYRLTPYDSYKLGLVKKIEVLTVAEKNDEATLKIELTQTKNGKGPLKAKVKAWHQMASGSFKFKETKWLKDGDNLGKATNNPSYLNYRISRINKSLRTQRWSVEFSNGVIIEEKQASGSIQSIWDLQLEWLIIRHFTKQQKLKEKGIKCLSLIFIDRVDNYVGENPVIKELFVKKYKEIYPEFHDGKTPTAEHIDAIQGFYFAKTTKGEYTDSEVSMRKNSEVYDAILKDKEELLSFGNSVANKIEFIFSHSALGVGWDNPNIFNIATLSNSYSEIKKRQEIGRGLRIAINQEGQRVYDDNNVTDEERINQLTVVPNETYETFVTQYQEEIKEVYGSEHSGATMAHTHKGEAKNKVHFNRNKNENIDQTFKRFWKALARKTDYTIAFDEQALIDRSIQAVNQIEIADYKAEVASRTIQDMNEERLQDTFGGTQVYQLKAHFSALDLMEELSEETGLAYPSVMNIVKGIANLEDFAKNPPQYIHLATSLIKNIELDEMLRGLNYHLTDKNFPFDFEDFVINIDEKRYVETPQRGVFDKMVIDSSIEERFAIGADYDDEVICFLKLPRYYKIPTPIGSYEPDFGIVMKRKQLRDGKENEFYFVIETKGTNDMNDKKALKPSEVYKIQCAVKHFETLGVDVRYKAPIKDYMTFKQNALSTIEAENK